MKQLSTYPVPHAHTHIDEHILAYRIIKDLGDYLPAVEEGVGFEVMIETSISRDFQLGPSAKGSSLCLGDSDTFKDA